MTKKLVVYILTAFLACMTLLCLCFPKQELSESERRKLKQFPEVTWNRIVSGRFMSEFEEYAADQFPLREVWRNLKANLVLNVFGQSDNNELFVEDGHVVKIEYPLNEDSIERAAKIFQRVYDTQIQGKSSNVFYSLIPDKNYFLGEDHLQMDYEKLESIMAESLSGMSYIDIMDMLEADDYYKTDAHWKQESIVDVAEALAEKMGADVKTEYQTMQLDTPFYGVYYGQSALRMEPDPLSYLTNDTLEACKVFDYQNNKETTVYDMEKAGGMDPYEMFLAGPISLIEITNPNADTEKELVIFRDSFGSAIAPLLAEGYAKIILIDIRYLPSVQAEKYIDFQDKDVLFLYSTSVLNHSETIK